MSIRVSASTDRVSRAANLPLQSAMTMAAWIKINARSGNTSENLLIHRQVGGQLNSQWYNTTLGAGVKQRLDWGSNSGNFSTEIPLSTWIYVAITSAGTASGAVWGYWGESSALFAGSGRALNSNSIATAYTAAGMAMLSHPANDGEQTDGWLAYGRVWDAVLTTTELQAELVSTSIVRTANINTAFTGVGGSGADVSGNGRNWTLTGTTSSVDDPLTVLRPNLMLLGVG